LHKNGFSSLCDRMCPLRLKLLVNVLPHPGTGQMNVASCLRRLCDALLVRTVVTFCFDTCIAPGPSTSGSSSCRECGDTFGEGYGEGRCDDAPLRCDPPPPRSLLADPDDALR
jgi:hypothetical protein